MKPKRAGAQRVRAVDYLYVLFRYGSDFLIITNKAKSGS
jgi:hypothetical protein